MWARRSVIKSVSATTVSRVHKRAASTRAHNASSFAVDPAQDLPKGPSVALFMNTEAPFSTTDSTTPLRPLRLAVSATGLTKDLIREEKVGRQMYYVWSDTDLHNMSVPGEDYAGETGEDALVFGHCAADSAVCHNYELLQTQVPKGMFRDTALPLPVARPVGNAPQESVVLAVADGVGGMASYGAANETALMSHELMREVRNNLTADTYSAKALLQRSWRTLQAKGSVSVGACTAAVAVVKPVKEDVWTHARYRERLPAQRPAGDDGQRLELNFANAGDSTIVAFRPSSGENGVTYVPLAFAWPLHHKYHTSNPPPVQLCIMQARDAATESVGAADHPADALHSTATAREAGAAEVVMGMVEGDYADAFTGTSDQPWLSAEGSALLQRGDVVCVFSDGVGDNLMDENFIKVLAEACESAAAYVGPQYKARSDMMRGVSAFRGGRDECPNAERAAEFDKTKTDAEAKEESEEKVDVEADTADVSKPLSCAEACVLAGNYSALVAGTVVRLCQRGCKVDDMSLVVGVVY